MVQIIRSATTCRRSVPDATARSLRHRNPRRGRGRPFPYPKIALAIIDQAITE